MPGVLEDDEVAARLRSVLAATPLYVRDQAATAAPRPAQPSRYTDGLAGLSAGGDPLNWSDIIPAWPDDVDLDPLPDPSPDDDGIHIPPDAAAAGAHVVASGVVALPPLPPEDTGGYRPGTPWASPPRAPDQVSRAPDQEFRAPDQESGEPMAEPEPFRAPATTPRTLPPPAWVLPEEEANRSLSWQFATAPEPEAPEFSTAGAFGGPSPQPERRFGLGAFDPGRRGVKALAAVAIVVIVIAAVLAWRARPRVDTVAPPAFTTTESTGGPTGEPARRTGAAAGQSSAPSELVVAVGGKVRKPGLVRLPQGARVADALTAAGGANPGVDVAILNLARKVVDGELIMVGVTPPPGVVATGPAAAPGAGGPPGGPVNLNTATLADLDTLPGVGPVLAQRILDARDAQGGFAAVSDLRKVSGIGDARYEQLKDLVTV